MNYQFKIHGRNLMVDKIQTAVNISLIDSGVNCIEQKLFAVHGARAAIGVVNCGTHPLKVAHYVTGDTGMNVGRLRNN